MEGVLFIRRRGSVGGGRTVIGHAPEVPAESQITKATRDHDTWVSIPCYITRHMLMVHSLCKKGLCRLSFPGWLWAIPDDPWIRFIIGQLEQFLSLLCWTHARHRQVTSSEFHWKSKACFPSSQSSLVSESMSRAVKGQGVRCDLIRGRMSTSRYRTMLGREGERGWGGRLCKI
jgi:hypothetical protein